MLKNNSKRLSAKVVLFNQESGEITIDNVIEKAADMVETRTGMFSTQAAKTYVDAEKGELVYVFNADIPAKLEAENLKKLRRDVTIKNLFNFERSASGGTDWLKIFPYIIIVVMVIFHK